MFRLQLIKLSKLKKKSHPYVPLFSFGQSRKWTHLQVPTGSIPVPSILLHWGLVRPGRETPKLDEGQRGLGGMGQRENELSKMSSPDWFL